MADILLSISELKLILQEIFIKSGEDFRNSAIASIKHRIETLMIKHNYIAVDDFVEKIRKDEFFVDELIFELCVSATEMFRDPEMWTALQTQILSKFRKKTNIEIAVPFCTTGEELYTLMYILNKADLLEKTNTVKFDPTVEIHFNLNLDPKHQDQMIRTTLSLPNGSGKTPKICVFSDSIEASELKKA